MKNKVFQWVLLCAGLLAACAGLLCLKASAGLQGALRTLPYVLIGLGCGAFGYAAGELINRRVLKKNPDLQKQILIEQRDERNRAISDRAKARAFDCMVFLFGALMLAFALMEVELAAVLLLVAAYLLVVGVSVYYRIKLEKEM